MGQLQSVLEYWNVHAKHVIWPFAAGFGCELAAAAILRTPTTERKHRITL